MLDNPPENLAAVSLIRATIADDPDSGILIMSQHGESLPGAEGIRPDSASKPVTRPCRYR
jgi:hypothetical protein